jgi:hypothetical protein
MPPTTLRANVGALGDSGLSQRRVHQQHFTIQGLTNLISPSSTLDFILIYDQTTGTRKPMRTGPSAPRHIGPRNRAAETRDELAPSHPALPKTGG